MKQKKITGRKLLSFLLSLAMILGLMPGMSLTAYAAETWSSDQTISENKEISGGVTVSSNITLTINDGVTLTVSDGINADGHTLTVTGKGSLVVTGANGRNSVETDGFAGGDGITGNLVVKGTKITVTGGNGGNGGSGGTGKNGGAGGNGVNGNVTVNGGSVFMSGGSGGAGGRSYGAGSNGSNGNAGAAITGTITGGDAEESDNNSNWSAISGQTSTKRYAKIEVAAATNYPLWVGGTQVTSANAEDSSHPSWSYNRDSKTLTLNGYNNNGNVGDKKAGIYAEEDLNIVTVGTNVVSNNSHESKDRAIEVNGTLIFKGNGTMNAKGGNRSIVAKDVIIESGTVKVSDGDYGICATHDITINGGVVSGNGNQIGLQSNHDVIINNGTVTASGTSEVGIVANNNVTIQGGSVETTGVGGIYAKSVTIKAGSVKATGTSVGILGNDGVDINGGTIDAVATASGESYGIYGNVKNSISGIGWTNTEGTEGKTLIPIRTSGQTLTYKRVQFPVYEVIYKVVNGTWSDDTTTDKTETVQSGSKPANVPTGMKASSGYTDGAWDTNPAEATITGTTTFTYTFTAVPSYEVTYKVVNGTWSDGSTADKTENVQSGSKPSSVPTGMKASSGYTGGAWDTDPTNATITGAATFTYAFTEKHTEPHNHDIIEKDALDPTCTEDGYKAHYECTECGKWFEDQNGHAEITDRSSFILKATGHKWDDGVVTKEATYDETGIKTFTCENDPSHTKEEEIPRKVYYERESDTDNSDGSSGSSGGSGSKNNSVSKQVIDVNGNVKSNVPSNHQAETGVPASDIGGRWANSANADTWTYTKSDGSLAKSEWLSLDYNGLRYWYYFNDDGNMHTNWFDYKGERFYLTPDKDGWRGRMATGWKNIDNKWYYFDIVPGSSQGRLYRSSVTPDGHTVGADGAWNGVGETPVGQE